MTICGSGGAKQRPGTGKLCYGLARKKLLLSCCDVSRFNRLVGLATGYQNGFSFQGTPKIEQGTTFLAKSAQLVEGLLSLLQQTPDGSPFRRVAPSEAVTEMV